MRYRLYYSHCGDAPTESISHFDSDKEAREYLEKERKHPSNAWDHITMERIDVEEKTTPIR